MKKELVSTAKLVADRPTKNVSRKPWETFKRFRGCEKFYGCVDKAGFWFDSSADFATATRKSQARNRSFLSGSHRACKHRHPFHGRRCQNSRIPLHRWHRRNRRRKRNRVCQRNAGGRKYVGSPLEIIVKTVCCIAVAVLVSIGIVTLVGIWSYFMRGIM